MHKIVSNTTPIISFLKLDRLDILRELYSEIIIPEAVFKEIEQGKDKAYYQDISQISWISIKKVKDKRTLQFFMDLDAGEAEAIALSVELNSDLLIIDEQLGRFHAKHAGLKVTGTLGVLLKAKEKGLITKIKPVIANLKNRGNWMSDKLVERVIKLAGEK